MRLRSTLPRMVGSSDPRRVSRLSCWTTTSILADSFRLLPGQKYALCVLPLLLLPYPTGFASRGRKFDCAICPPFAIYGAVLPLPPLDASSSCYAVRLHTARQAHRYRIYSSPAIGFSSGDFVSDCAPVLNPESLRSCSIGQS